MKAPRHPMASELRAAREAAGLTQTQAGALIYAPLRTWQDWEGGRGRMNPALWEYWQLLVADPQIRPKVVSGGRA